MAQIFHRSTNFYARLSLLVVALAGGLGLAAVLGLAHVSYFTRQYIVRDQPIQFSHKHHAGDDGIDCRYCHTGVETSAVAGIPPTKTCMNCHSVLFNNVGYLEPVRQSYSTDKSIEWVKVHRLADFAYFNHSVHVNKGFGCEACHGPVNQMPLTWQHGSLLMEWCLNCHREPDQHLRPRDKVYEMNWDPSQLRNAADNKPYDQETLGRKLAKEYDVHSLLHCSTCHR